MKIKTIENFSNVEKAKPYTTVMDPVMDIAVKEDEEVKKKTKDVFDPYERAKAKPFLGAEKQPVPKAPVEPKLTLKESVGSYSDKLYDMVEDELLESTRVVSKLVDCIPDKKLKEFFKLNKIKPSLNESSSTDPRYYSNELIDMIEGQELDAKEIALSLIKWLPDSEIADFMETYDLLDYDWELEESLLTERNWKVQLENGKELRKAIQEENYEGIIEGIKACYKEMLDKGVIDEDDFEDWTEQLDWLDLDDEDAEEAIDYELSNLYDACDNLDCWVTM